MKTRSGFVSNSSSSSFILHFKEMPKCVRDIEKRLSKDYYGGPFFNEYPKQHVAERLFSALETGKTGDHDIQQEIADCWDEVEDPTRPQSPDTFSAPEWEEYHKKVYAWAETKKEEILKKYQGEYFALVEFSDNDGPLDSMMEHSGCFDNFVVQRFCKH